jgi:Bacterial membrane protein YfhO
MKIAANNTKPAPVGPKNLGWFAPVLLSIVLAVLFWRSFVPGYVHFSNDGPLGMQNSAWMRLPDGFSGLWYDLNSIGNSAGAFSPDLTTLIRWIIGPVAYAKFLAPIALWILGVGAWFCFRQMKLSPLAAVLGGLAAALNSDFFSTACWGVASQQIAIGMDFFALGLVAGNSPAMPVLTRWARLALAGLCVGMNVMSAADIGAIFSVFIAAFVFYKALTEEGGPLVRRISGGISRVAVIAVFAVFLALQTVLALVGTAITGVVGTGQDAETKLQHWDWATQWSLPKAETLGLVVPGLFGYKLDTPKDMMPMLQNAYKNGEYWGGVGRDPAIDRYFDAGLQGEQPPGFMRFTGGGNYLGILVALLAAFAIAQSLRRENCPFTETQKRLIWFWAVVVAGSLLLSWGRFAPVFYKIFYALPYASTIRNPAKFVLTLSWATVILFAYGVHVLSRRYLEVPAGSSSAVSTQLINWWEKARGFDRKWTLACAGTFGGSVLAWLIYAAQKPALVKYLESVGFPDPATAGEIAGFSIGQVGWFLVIFAVAVALCILILAGVFSGKRARLGGLLLGIVLVFDLGRANLPYIIHWDYAQKYEVGSLNPIVGFLKDKPYEHRVALLPFRMPDQFQVFDELYRIEWAQQLFPYYNIQSLDIVQMSRMPADLAAFEGAFAPRGDADSLWQIPRRWQLTNTRYLLGPAGYLDVLNSQLDPEQKRFRIVKRFDVVLKPGVDEFHQRLEELTAIPSDENENGKYTTFCKDLALFEFTGALPRAKLYSNWQVSTNDEATLKLLADKNFDPQQTILVSTPLPAAPAANSTNENSGTVDFKSYKPTDIVFDTKSDVTSVLLLNDKYDADWHVTVDGKPAELLRCNFIMRGVYLPPGSHTVEFRFTLPKKPLFITVAAMAVGILLIGLLIVLQKRKPTTI